MCLKCVYLLRFRSADKILPRCEQFFEITSPGNALLQAFSKNTKSCWGLNSSTSIQILIRVIISTDCTVKQKMNELQKPRTKLHEHPCSSRNMYQFPEISVIMKLN